MGYFTVALMRFLGSKLFVNWIFGLSLPSLNAGVVKLVDTLDLGSSAARRGGSSPFTRTSKTLSFC